MSDEHAGPAILVILDGWGLETPGPGNAIALADTPVFDQLWAYYPHTTLTAGGRDVGLTEGQMGNSEVGHLNIGAGFIVNQLITQIDLAIEEGTFFDNAALLHAMTNARAQGKTLHLLGLVSDGGVHSHIRHLDALLVLARKVGVERVAIHAMLDGRDTSPTSGADFLRAVQAMCAARGVGRIVSVIGRYYAMDRDRRWERTRVAYELLVDGAGEAVSDPVAAVEHSYAEGVTDEFISPLSVRLDAAPPVTIQAGDSVIFFNFRSDRPRQLTQALLGPDVVGVAFLNRPEGLVFVTMAPYADYLPVPAAFEPATVEWPLGRVVAEAGLAQFHSAETEKYAHVTYFLNGGREEPFLGEERVLAPSPQVATYDLQPEMSARAVADAALAAISSRRFGLVVLNFANCDMVGHTGVLRAAVAATEAVDRELGRVIDATLDAGGIALVIADHGNAERMLVPGSNEPMTAHTTNPVPCVLVAGDTSPWRRASLRAGGRLADVAPTMLQVMGIAQPAVMTGESLVEQGGT